MARNVPGVLAMDNKVSLKGAPTSICTKVDDTLTTTRVKAALMANEGVTKVSNNMSTKQ